MSLLVFASINGSLLRSCKIFKAITKHFISESDKMEGSLMHLAITQNISEFL
jgi:hypothetical protein